MSQPIWIELIGPSVSLALAFLTILLTREKASGSLGTKVASLIKDNEALRITVADHEKTMAIHTTLLRGIEDIDDRITVVETAQNKEEGRREAERDLRRDSSRGGRRPPQT